MSTHKTGPAQRRRRRRLLRSIFRKRNRSRDIAPARDELFQPLERRVLLSSGAAGGFEAQAGFPAMFELSSLNGTNGFVINGIDAIDFSGKSVSGAGRRQRRRFR